jgi:urea transport system permease protein
MASNSAAPAAGNATRWRPLTERALLRELALILIVGAVLFMMPLLLSDFRLNQLGKFLTFAIVAIGIDLLWGYTGMLSLGQGVFFGLGGYAMAMYLKLEASGDKLPDFMTWSGVSSLPWFWEPFRYPWLAFPIVLLGPGLLAFLFGYLLFRSRIAGVYFSIVTQASALILSTFMIGQQGVTGGTNGLTNFTELFGMTLRSPETQQTLYLATVVVLGLTYIFARLVAGSRLGRLMIAVRDDEDRVRFSGYNVALIKATVFGIAGMMAGVAGALFVPQVGIISPANLGVVPSIEMVLWVAVGGRGTLGGAVAGALVVSWARSYLSESFPESWLYAIGALFIGSVVLFPRGLAGFVKDLWARIGTRVGKVGGRAPSGSIPSNQSPPSSTAG